MNLYLIYFYKSYFAKNIDDAKSKFYKWVLKYADSRTYLKEVKQI